MLRYHRPNHLFCDEDGNYLFIFSSSIIYFLSHICYCMHSTHSHMHKTKNSCIWTIIQCLYLHQPTTFRKSIDHYDDDDEEDAIARLSALCNTSGIGVSSQSLQIIFSNFLHGGSHSHPQNLEMDLHSVHIPYLEQCCRLSVFVLPLSTIRFFRSILSGSWSRCDTSHTNFSSL